MATNNIINSPKSAFLGYSNTTNYDVTGDGSAYQLGAVQAINVPFNLANELSTGGVFTAAYSGVYSLTAEIAFKSSITSSMTSGSINFTVSTGDVYSSDLQNPYAAQDTAYYSFHINRMIYMIAGQTVVVKTIISGGTKTADGDGSGLQCRLSGFLVI